jgi:hypothetical protein
LYKYGKKLAAKSEHWYNQPEQKKFLIKDFSS